MPAGMRTREQTKTGEENQKWGRNQSKFSVSSVNSKYIIIQLSLKYERQLSRDFCQAQVQVRLSKGQVKS